MTPIKIAFNIDIIGEAKFNSFLNKRHTIYVEIKKKIAVLF